MSRKKKPPHPCSGCSHFYGYNNNVRCCNYLFDTGSLRPCPPGRDCTVRLNGKHRRGQKQKY